MTSSPQPGALAHGSALRTVRWTVHPQSGWIWAPRPDYPRLVRIAFALVVVASLTGCGPVPDGCWDRSETFFRLDAFGSELPVPPDDVMLTGAFDTWGIGESIFETTNGEQYGFGLIVEGEVALPDLGSFGAIDLRSRGFVGDSTEPTAPLLEVFAAGAPDELLAVIGNRELREADSPLALSAPRDDDTCMQYSHEDGHARNKPVAITYGSGSATLFQGETAALDGLSVSVVAAQSNNRSHPWAPCRGELCPWEKLAWYAIDADLEPVPPL